MYHRNYTTYLQKELDFLKLLVARFHEQENVNGLELDVALQKTQEVYGQLLQMKLTPETATLVEKKSPKADLPEKEQSLKSHAGHVAPITASIPEPVPEKVVVTEEKKIVPAPVYEEKKQQVDSAKAAILAEKISPTDFHPINETLAHQKTGADLSSKLQTAPLSSITSGIGLNDKFLYIRELFYGDNALYNNTIRDLDAAKSLDSALDFIQLHFDWDEKNETAQKFIALVYRRHGMN